MTKVDGAYKSLLQGMSQQPARDRQSGQAELVKNMSSKPIDGLTDRAPVDRLAIFDVSIPDDALIHVYDRGDGERYIIIVHSSLDQGFAVYDWEGNKQISVRQDGVEAYTDGCTLLNGHMSTVGDYTMLVNRSVIVGESTTKPNNWQPWEGAVVQIHNWGFGRRLIIRAKNDVGTVHIEYTSPSGSTKSSDGNTDLSEANPIYNDASFITQQLAHASTGLGDYPVYAAGYEDALEYTGTTTASVTQCFDWSNSMDVYNEGPYLVILGATSIEVTGDGVQDSVAYACTYAKEPSDLPAKGLQDQIVKISSDDEADSDSYYMKFVYDEPSVNSVQFSAEYTGSWQETIGDGVTAGCDTSTMPHAIARIPEQDEQGRYTFYLYEMSETGGSYTIGDNTYNLEGWAVRDVGDDISNPLPQFVGGTIQGIGQFQDRMYIYAGEFLHFSKTSLYWDLYVASTIAYADDDGFYVTSATAQVQEIKHVIPSNRNLVCFTNNAQFIIDGGVRIIPSDCVMSLATAFDGDMRVPPVNNGNIIYFGYRSGLYTGVKEFYTENLQSTNNARSISSHVERLMQGQMKQFIASNQENYLFAIPYLEERSRIYVYQYQFAESGERLQSAWSYWEVESTDIITGWVSDTYLYLIYRDRDTGREHLGYINFQDNIPSGIPYNPRLDDRTLVQDVVQSIPWELDTYAGYGFVLGADTAYPGMYAYPDYIEDGMLYFRYPVNGSIYVGKLYDMRYTPTRPFVIDQNGTPVTTDRLAIKQYLLHLEGTGTCNTELSSDYYDDMVIPFSGRKLGSVNNLVGKPALYTGTYPVMVNTDADVFTVTFTKNAVEPFRLVDLEWRGQYKRRSNRV